MTPFPPVVAGMVGLLLGLLGALGRFVVSSAARGRASAHGDAPWQEVVGRPGAIAFAAPVFFHLLHGLYAG